MSTDLLKLTQWLSPAFPLGAYAYSHGLETAIADGGIADAKGLKSWLSVVLETGSGQADAVLLVGAMAPDADHEALSDWARALCASAERLRETDDQGAAFTRTVNALTGRTDCSAPLPVAVGRAARQLSVSPEDVAALYLQAFIGNLVTVAVRHVPLGQTEGQKVLSDLNPLIARVARKACEIPVEEITTSALGSDLSAFRHETQEVRIFKT